MKDNFRVRYAPSPTGIPHVGNVRTALFNWLLARHTGGTFIVRVEDTDQNRIVEGAIGAILESLRWLGIDWDEGPTGDGQGSRGPFGPYFQAQRQELHQRHVEQLVASGKAYICWCSPDRLAQLRQNQQERKVPPGYDRHCRDLSDNQRSMHERSGNSKVVRFAMPREGATTFTDLIRGLISFENRLLDDFVILKSDGYPTYHLANVVDDHHMQISHVLRADEWVSSTPKHVLLYTAFGWTSPAFAHLPMILGADRAKLSKRHGATSLLEYREEGFLPEAMMNFLALLGWALDDKTEMFTKEELVRNFTVDRIGKTGAIFNKEKLAWMNGVYVRGMASEQLAERMVPFVEANSAISAPVDRDYLSNIVPLVHDRLKRLDESGPLVDFFFVDEIQHKTAELVQKGMDPHDSMHVLESATSAIRAIDSFDAKALESALRPLADSTGLKTGQVFGTLRVAVTGRTVAPPLFETMVVLGQERCISRMAAALRVLGSVADK